MRLVRHDVTSAEEPQGAVDVGVRSGQRNTKYSDGGRQEVGAHDQKRRHNGQKSPFVVKASRDETRNCRRRHFRPILVTGTGTLCKR